MNYVILILFSCLLLQFASFWFKFKTGANMGSKQWRKKKTKVLKDEELTTNIENEAQCQWERRQRIKDLNNVSKEKDIEDTMMDEEVEEENPMQGNLGAHFNQTFNTGMSPNPQIFSHDEIGVCLEVGYDLHFLHENKLSTQKNSIEMHAPKEIPRKIKNEIQIPNNSENKISIENKNFMNVDIETPTTKQTCQNDNKVSKHNFNFPNNVLDNLEGFVSWRPIRTHANRLYRHFFIIRNLGFNVS